MGTAGGYKGPGGKVANENLPHTHQEPLVVRIMTYSPSPQCSRQPSSLLRRLWWVKLGLGQKDPTLAPRLESYPPFAKSLPMEV